MLLTNSEIVNINQNAEFDGAIGYARAIESAVLEKLKAQEPDKTKIECVTGAIYKHISGEFYPREVIAAAQYIVHRYCTTPDDVVRDAARYRFLRDEAYLVNPVVAVVWKRNDDRDESEWVNTVDGYSLDCHIDAAMEKVK